MKTLGNPVDLGLVFQDRPEADRGLPHSLAEEEEEGKLDGLLVHTVL